MKKIYINPGHSDKDPGAVGYETERRLNVAVSRHMNDYLLANYGCETRMNPGTMDSLSAICSDANRWGADLFVSNHFNAGGGDGYEALVYSLNRVELGGIFEKHVKEIGQNSRGVKLRPDLAVLKNTAMPAILNEGAFVDNPKDIEDWNDNAELQALGVAYAKAAAEYLALPRKKEEPAEKPAGSSFAQSVQAVLGITGEEILPHTITVSAYCNRTHPVVRVLQQRLFALGYTQVGEADGIAGAKFTAAVKAFQRDHGCVVDGEITAGHKTWQTLLTMV